MNDLQLNRELNFARQIRRVAISAIQGQVLCLLKLAGNSV